MLKKILIFLACILAALSCRAEEAITNFDVELSLDKYGNAEVREEITINAEHLQIKRGIYRSIPKEKNIKIKVESLEMDHAPHPYTINSARDFIINFGGENFIEKGKHKYILVYKISNIIDKYKNYDELYWNITGNKWDFPIQNASFSFKPPQDIQIISEGISLYTGAYESKNGNAEQYKNLNFRTTAPLNKYEGFTIAIPFKKGFIELSPLEIFFKYLKYVSFILLLIYCAATWYLYGKDPKYEGRILFAPPKGLSPAMAGYIIKRTPDINFLTASVVDLAVKKVIKISSDKKNIELKITNKRREKDLPQEQKLIIKTIKNSIILNGKFNKALKVLVEDFDKSIKTQGEQLIKKNYIFIIPPIFMFVLIIFQLIYNLDESLVGVWFPFILLLTLRPAIKNITWILFPFFVFFIYIITNDYIITAAAAVIALYALTIDNTAKQAQEIYLDTLGFKKYMDTAEKHRAEKSNPEDALQIFADYLPYAYAFRIEGKWIKNFEKILSKEIINKKCLEYGGVRLLSSTLASNITNGGGGSGSFGGGHSGGGHGGGGGGGR